VSSQYGREGEGGGARQRWAGRAEPDTRGEEVGWQGQGRGAEAALERGGGRPDVEHARLQLLGEGAAEREDTWTRHTACPISTG